MDEADFWREYVEKASMMTDSEVEEGEVEEYLDGCASTAPAYQARRDARKQAQRDRQNARRNFERHAMSPPPTPPLVRDQQQAPKACRNIPPLHLNGSQVLKRKLNTRKAPRRPITRSQGRGLVTLSDEKGMVRYWRDWIRWSYVDMTFATYLRDFDGEKLRLEYPEEYNLGATWVTPLSERHAEYQRKQRARVARQKATLKSMVTLPKGHKGFI